MSESLTQPGPRVTTAQKIDDAAAEGRAALIGYLPAGYPTLQESIDAGIALAQNGCDIIEIGIPYSDPVMDGPVIQEATSLALANGFHVSQAFDVVRAITDNTDAAVVIMTYWNPVLRMGVDTFAKRLADAGGAGLITPDLIPDEAAEWIEASDKYGLDRIFLAAPTSTPERLALVAKSSRGFVYGVSLMGVTGARSEVSHQAESVVQRTREAGAERVCVGIGVSTPEQAAEIARYADGVIVGTALVAALRDGGANAVAQLVSELSQGVHK